MTIAHDRETTPDGDCTDRLLTEFLEELRNYSAVYSYFFNESYRLKVLQPTFSSQRVTPRSPPRSSKHTSVSAPKIRSSGQQNIIVPISVSASTLGSKSKLARLKTITGVSGRTLSTKKLLREDQTRSSMLPSTDLSSHFCNPIIRDAMGRVTKVYYIDPGLLDQQRHSVLDRYREICGLPLNAEIRTARLSAEKCRAWLELRYPAEMVETMMRLLDFTTSKSSVQYYSDIERLITVKDDKLVQAAFDIFDLDKDHIISTKDAFRAIELRLFDTYDSDLVKLKQILKTKRAIHKNCDSEVRSIVGVEGVTLGEFRKIEFVGNRPQVIVDFLVWVSGVNVLELAGFVAKRQKTIRKDSEELVLDSTQPTKDRTSYLQSLVAPTQQLAKAHYPESTRESLLSRFQELQSSEVQGAIITSASFQNGFVTYTQAAIFGAASPYIASRVYELLCRPDGKDLTRLKFLENVLPLICEDRGLQSRFVFDVIDYRGDGALTGDEVDAFLAELPPRSPIFFEVMK